MIKAMVDGLVHVAYDGSSESKTGYIDCKDNGRWPRMRALCGTWFMWDGFERHPRWTLLESIEPTPEARGSLLDGASQATCMACIIRSIRGGAW